MVQHKLWASTVIMFYVLAILIACHTQNIQATKGSKRGLRSGNTLNTVAFSFDTSGKFSPPFVTSLDHSNDLSSSLQRLLVTFGTRVHH